MIFDFFKKKDSAPDIDPGMPGSMFPTDSRIDELGLGELVRSLPWKARGIYLEDNAKQVKAVCGDEDVARILAQSMEHYTRLPDKDLDRGCVYKDFMQDAYYLYLAMSKAQIQVNSLETAFVEKAFHQFCKSFNKLLSVEHISLENPDSRPEVNK